MYKTEGKTLLEMHWEGLALISTVASNKPDDMQVWPFIVNGFYDVPLSIAFFYTANARLPNEGEDYMGSAVAQNGLQNTKNYLRDLMHAIIDPEGYKKAEDARQAKASKDLFAQMDRMDRERRKNYRLQKEAEERVEREKRDAFNSQHKPAPEGTVKELAARYGKSIGEIRKLKAAGQLHTLVETA